MSSYYANVTFPNSALNIPALRKLYRSLPTGYVLEQDATVTLADPNAEFGRMAVTELLDALQVPYDHYHRNEAGRNVYTQQVRFVDGQRVMKVVRDADEVLRKYARDLLDLVEAGSLDLVREQLDYTVNKAITPSIVTIATEWDPENLFLLFNAEEARENGTGYWSQLEGWTVVQHASVFTSDQRAAYEADDTTTWQSLADALSSVRLVSD